MLAHERRHVILTTLAEQGSITVLEIEASLGCSQATIRRDLAELEQSGQLTRVHGGAVLSKVNQEDRLLDKFDKQASAKQAVAQYVGQHFLDQHRVIFLDAGSATHFVIPFLQAEKHLVVTNGIHHLDALLMQQIPTIFIGGQLKPATQAIVGTIALQQIAQYQFDLAILGTNSVDKNFGLSTPTPEEALLKTLAIQQARQTIVLADASKFDASSFHQFANLQDVLLITDTCPKSYHTIQTVHCLSKKK